jgi:glucans biosynthesis protein
MRVRAKMPMMDRRNFLAAGFSSMLVAAAPAGIAGAQRGPVFGPQQPFSFDRLSRLAKMRAGEAYKAPSAPAADLLNRIDFDAVQKIRFRPEYALWNGAPSRLPVSFFHLNKYAVEPVKIYALAGGMAREILYGSQYFDYGGTGLDMKLPADAGFSGFRVMNGQSSPIDWLAFQGASYFRSSGSEDQYGASARGIAINTALSTTEEFPRFSHFWLEEQGQTVIIYALLDGPSITGAYRFDAVKGDSVVMQVHAELFARADIARLGIAPLTSMYWYGENTRATSPDWRPEIHDSDGLALWTGTGERIWRPLNDPRTLQTNSFADKSPKGFGLMQRDRSFENYQDDGAFYNKRPGIWVEPRGDWGEGAVQLIEIPTDDETHDNIVAYWQPKSSVSAGDSFKLDYKLYWQDREPGMNDARARIIATRRGRGGIPGVTPPPAGKQKFVIDFQGGPLSQMEARFDVIPVVTTSRGKIENAYVIKVVGTDRWRAFFDLAVDGTAPVNLRCFLRLDGKALSETWLYQYLA